MSARKPTIHNPFARVGLGKELDYLIENMSMLVSAGMPIAGALESIAEEVASHEAGDYCDANRCREWLGTVDGA